MSEENESEFREVGQFPETRWSLLIRVNEGSETARFGALSELCELYWFPLYAYLRRYGKSAQDAEDLTQSFFARMLETDSLERLAQVEGRLRSYLLASIKNHMASDWRQKHAQKRGGNITHVAIDREEAEHRYRNEPGHEESPEKVFDRQWALTLLSRAMKKLRNDYADANKGSVFDGLQPYLDEKSKHVDAAQIGTRLDMSEGAVRVALHRMRRRFREHIESEIAETVPSREDVDDEIHYLWQAVAH